MEEKSMTEKVATGKILQKEGKYFLDVGGKQEELPLGFLTDRKFLNEQAGKEVEVIYTIPKSFVAAIRFPGRPPIVTCNMIAGPFLRGETVVTQPSPAVTHNVATALLEGGFISREVFEKLVANPGAER
jgi:hypothetical protein